jgi:hypothetical protein
MVVTLFKVDNREIRGNRHTRQLEETKHTMHRSKHAVVQREDNDSEKETLMIGVQKKLMIKRNKRNYKNKCEEEADNDEERNDIGGCAKKLMIMVIKQKESIKRVQKKLSK